MKKEDKVELITSNVETYEHECNEPEFCPEFVQKLQLTESLKGIRFKSVNVLRARYE